MTLKGEPVKPLESVESVTSDGPVATWLCIGIFVKMGSVEKNDQGLTLNISKHPP